MKVLLVGEGASELAGALKAFVNRMGISEHEIEQDKVSRRDIHAHHGKGKGYYKRAIRWMREAQKNGYDAIILLIDQDDRPERVKEFAAAQEYLSVPIRRALGVATRTFDAWMLADEKALTTVLEYQVSRQTDPEKLADPKRVCTDLLENSPQDMSPAKMYAAIANIVDISVLEARCSKGFGPFAQRVRELSQ